MAIASSSWPYVISVGIQRAGRDREPRSCLRVCSPETECFGPEAEQFNMDLLDGKMIEMSPVSQWSPASSPGSGLTASRRRDPAA